jgi:xanthine dehydrogenase YagR molybdenum-binding subunit
VDIQTRTCIADWDGQRLTVHDSAQGVWNVKLQLAQSLGLDPERVRVNVQYMGGGFGSKAGAQRYAHYAARLAMVTGRPVKLEMTRREEFLSHPRRYSGVVRVRLGARRDGTLTAIVFAVDLDLGAGTLFRLVSHREMVFTHVAELYACPAVAIDIRGVYTNTPPTGPQRGVLNQVASYTMEAAMDTLARALDRDPVEVRLRNDSPWADPEARIAFSSKRLTECADAVTAALGWERRAAIEADNRGQTRKRGLGIAFYAIERAGVPPYQARAEVLVTPDGKVELRAGVVEIGAGQVTVLAMLAAEELGVDLEAVRVVWGDTDGTLYAPSSHASRVTIEMGPAVLQAAALARRELFRYAGPWLDAPDEELRSGGGRIYVKSADWRSITFAEACRLLPPEGIRSVGSRGPNPENPVLRAFGVQGMEVEVDEESGEIRVVRVVSAHDIGRALNPKLVESQHHGAILMGLGYGRWEEPEFDPKTGRLLNTDVHQYRIPTALETPAIEVINIEGEDRFYPYSAKPVGEAPFLGVAPAFRNAVLHATGLHINELPITVPRLLEALESRHRSGRAG